MSDTKFKRTKDDLEKLINGSAYAQISLEQIYFYLGANGIDEKHSRYIDYLTEIKKWLLEKGCLSDEVDDEASAPDIKPFDFTKIKISQQSITLTNIIDRIESEEIDMFPDFQRKSGLWKEGQKSRLIESLILGIPLPLFYFDTTDKNRWVVVDGLQRLTTIKEYFVDKRLSLTDMEFLKDLDGKNYHEVPPSSNRRMKEKNLQSVMIEEGTPPEVRLNIFKRINTGGLQLTQQEIIHALAPQNVRTFLKTLADNVSFKRATDYSISSERMLDREFALRFASYTLCGVEAFKKAETLEGFLDLGIKALSTKNAEELEAIKQSFIGAMDLSYSVFNKSAFRRISFEGRRGPISKALFDTISVLFSKLSENEKTALIEKKEIFKAKLIYEFENISGQFLHDMRSGRPAAAENRLNKIKALIEETLNDN